MRTITSSRDSIDFELLILCPVLCGVLLPFEQWIEKCLRVVQLEDRRAGRRLAATGNRRCKQRQIPCKDWAETAARSTPASFKATVYCTRASFKSRLFCNASVTAWRSVSFSDHLARATPERRKESRGLKPPHAFDTRVFDCVYSWRNDSVG